MYVHKIYKDTLATSALRRINAVPKTFATANLGTLYTENETMNRQEASVTFCIRELS